MIKIVAFFVALIVGCSCCSSPVDYGTGTKPSQKFYFNQDWGLCIAFQYKGAGGNDNRFDSIADCRKACLLLDGSPCKGPNGYADVKDLFSCDTAKCPKGFECKMGMHPACCSIENSKESDLAWDNKCPNKKEAEGFGGEFSWAPLVGSTCKDLTCKKGNKCIQVSKHFAKCCGKK